MNKRLVFFVVVIGLMLVTPLLVSAQYSSIDLRGGSEQLIDLVTEFAEPFLQILLGGQDYTGLLLFERFLVFILLVSVVYLSIGKVPVFEDQKVVIWIIAIIIPLLGIRFIDFVWLNTILISYQLLGIVMAGILPFIIYLFFLHNVSDEASVRKIGWIFFIVVYFGLWATHDTESYTQIYFWTMLIALLFLLMDKTIHRWYSTQGMSKANRAAIYEKIGEFRQRILDLESRPGLSKSARRQARKDLLRKIKNLEKALN